MGKYRLTIRLNTNETIFVEGKGLIDHDELISQRIESGLDIISFGSVGVKRELIDWYTIEEVV